MGQNMQICHSLRCKLLADNIESLGTSFSKTSLVESGHLAVYVFRFCKYVIFCLWAFAYTKMKAERGIYDFISNLPNSIVTNILFLLE